MFSIYQINNLITNNSYVGFTSENPPTARWKTHQQKARRGATTHLHCAIRKYGVESFIFSILEEGWDPKIGKDIREPYWISVLKPEYNHTQGGEGTLGYKRTQEQVDSLAAFNRGKPRSQESRNRQSFATKGVPKSLEHKEHIRKALMGTILTKERRKKIGAAHRGKVMSTETRLKMSTTHKGQIPWNKGKKYVQHRNQL